MQHAGHMTLFSRKCSRNFCQRSFLPIFSKIWQQKPHYNSSRPIAYISLRPLTEFDGDSRRVENMTTKC